MFRCIPGGSGFKAALAVSLLIGLSGSALAAPVVTRTDMTPLYSASEVMAAKRHDSLPTEVVGGPSSRATAAATVAPLSLPATVGGGRMVPVRAGTQEPGMRIVLLFNTNDFNPETACRAPQRSGARKVEGPLDVFAVLCEGESFFSQAHLRDDSVSGEHDPNYAGAMSQLFLALMPERGERERERED